VFDGARRTVQADRRQRLTRIVVGQHDVVTALGRAAKALLAKHSSLGPLLLVGLVSAVENFFRDVFSRVITICPTSQAAAAEQSVCLGAVVWHGSQLPERGAFEHLSFASADEVRKICKKFLGYEVQKHGSANAALDEYDKVCELRHGIVHAGGQLPARNAIRLHISRRQTRMGISIGYAELQECGAVCSSLVAAFNTELFGELARRWAMDWSRKPSWDPKGAGRRFREIPDLFLSQIDASDTQIPEPMTLKRCMAHVLGEYA